MNADHRESKMRILSITVLAMILSGGCFIANSMAAEEEELDVSDEEVMVDEDVNQVDEEEPQVQDEIIEEESESEQE